MEYASVEDVEASWRPLQPAEQSVAQNLLRYASAKMRRVQPALDAMLAAGTIDPVDAEAVAVGMVKRAMLNGNNEGVSQSNQTAGPFTIGATFSNPEGSLYLTADDKDALGANRGRRARSVLMG